ncbi:MAG TPA: RNA degradosome polyphosphate kinase, partial [Candidatus Brocadiia bacterium]|nr:RNA degradosome polyphosphate kinase [Candidatus Brocadiia bacterium]
MARETQPRFFNRELSWLEFNHRVLEEALDPQAPTLERLKFLAIVSSNLDEFFAVRVAALKNQEALAPGAVDPAGLTATEQLDAVRARVRAMTAAQYKCLRDSLWPALEAAGVRQKKIVELNRDQIAYLDTHFEREILPTLTPMAADGGRPFPTLGDGELCLAVSLR